MYFLRTGIFLISCILLSGKLMADATVPAASAYQESLQDWKSQIKKLQGIRDRLAAAQGEALKDLRKDYLQAVADAKPALRHFTTAAEEALKRRQLELQRQLHDC